MKPKPNLALGKKKGTVGWRTGEDVKAGRNIRTDQDGFENFSDYWSEPESELDDEQILEKWKQEKHRSFLEKSLKRVNTRSKGDPTLRSMSPFTPTTNETDSINSSHPSCTPALPVTCDQDQNSHSASLNKENLPNSTQSIHTPSIESNNITSNDSSIASIALSVNELSAPIIDGSPKEVINDKQKGDSLCQAGGPNGSITQPTLPNSAVQVYRTRKRLEYSTMSSDLSLQNICPPKEKEDDPFLVPGLPAKKTLSKKRTKKSSSKADIPTDPKSLVNCHIDLLPVSPATSSETKAMEYDVVDEASVRKSPRLKGAVQCLDVDVSHGELPDAEADCRASDESSGGRSDCGANVTQSELPIRRSARRGEKKLEKSKAQESEEGCHGGDLGIKKTGQKSLKKAETTRRSLRLGGEINADSADTAVELPAVHNKSIVEKYADTQTLIMTQAEVHCGSVSSSVAMESDSAASQENNSGSDVDGTSEEPLPASVAVTGKVIINSSEGEDREEDVSGSDDMITEAIFVPEEVPSQINGQTEQGGIMEENTDDAAVIHDVSRPDKLVAINQEVLLQDNDKQRTTVDTQSNATATKSLLSSQESDSSHMPRDTEEELSGSSESADSDDDGEGHSDDGDDVVVDDDDDEDDDELAGDESGAVNEGATGTSQSVRTETESVVVGDEVGEGSDGNDMTANASVPDVLPCNGLSENESAPSRDTGYQRESSEIDSSPEVMEVVKDLEDSLNDLENIVTRSEVGNKVIGGVSITKQRQETESFVLSPQVRPEPNEYTAKSQMYSLDINRHLSAPDYFTENDDWDIVDNHQFLFANKTGLKSVHPTLPLRSVKTVDGNSRPQRKRGKARNPVELIDDDDPFAEEVEENHPKKKKNKGKRKKSVAVTDGHVARKTKVVKKTRGRESHVVVVKESNQPGPQEEIVNISVHQDVSESRLVQQDEVVNGSVQQDEVVNGSVQLDEIVNGSVRLDESLNRTAHLSRSPFLLEAQQTPLTVTKRSRNKRLSQKPSVLASQASFHDEPQLESNQIEACEKPISTKSKKSKKSKRNRSKTRGATSPPPPSQPAHDEVLSKILPSRRKRRSESSLPLSDTGMIQDHRHGSLLSADPDPSDNSRLVDGSYLHVMSSASGSGLKKSRKSPLPHSRSSPAAQVSFSDDHSSPVPHLHLPEADDDDDDDGDDIISHKVSPPPTGAKSRKGKKSKKKGKKSVPVIQVGDSYDGSCDTQLDQASFAHPVDQPYGDDGHPISQAEESYTLKKVGSRRKNGRRIVSNSPVVDTNCTDSIDSFVSNSMEASLEIPFQAELSPPAKLPFDKRKLVQINDMVVQHKFNPTASILGTPLPKGTRKSILKRGSMSEPRNSQLSAVDSPLHVFQMTAHNTFMNASQRKGPTIIPPSPPREGLRRSQRTRVPILRTYMNERIRYKRKSGGLVIDGIDYPEHLRSKPKTGAVEQKVRQELRKEKNRQARKQKQMSTPRNLSVHVPLMAGDEEEYSSVLPVPNPMTGREVLVECQKRPCDFEYMGPAGGPAQPSDSLILCKPLRQAGFSMGRLILRPLMEKGKQYVRNDTMGFMIQQGKLAVTIHRTTTILETNATFFVPQGSTYSIRNLRDEEAKLWFFQIKGN